MRETLSQVSSRRFAWAVSPGGDTNTLVNAYDEVTLVRGVRSDVTRTPKPVNPAWRPPLPYTASFTGSDVIYVDTLLQYRTVSPWLYGNIGKLGSNAEGANLRVSESDILALMPSQADVDRAIVLARNNVADRAASFGESIVEARKTVQMLGDMAGQLDKFLIASARKDWRGAARALNVKPSSTGYKRAVRNLQGAAGTTSNAWLQFNFGLAPIVSDMVSTAVLLSGEWNFRVTGKTVLVTSKSETLSKERTPLGFTPAAVNWVSHAKVQAGVHVRLDYTLSDTFLQGFAKFGVSDVVQVGWALVPNSFLVDFVLPVSEVLRSLTATIGLSYVGGSSTRFCRIDRWSTDCVLDPQGLIVKHASFLNARARGRKMDRKVYKSEPNPVTLWVKDPLNAFAVSTVLAVLGQRLSKLSPYK